MYINLAGCDEYPGKIYHYDSGMYTHNFDEATNMGTPRFCAHKDATGLEWTNPHTGLKEPLPEQVRSMSGKLLYTKTGSASPVVTIVYFVLFIIISALVMLSLFIGAVTMAMTTSMEEMKEEQEEAAQRTRAE